MGHKGASQTRKSDKTVIVQTKNCTNCGSIDIAQIGYTYKSVTDIPKTVAETIIYKSENYSCKNCHHKFKPNDPGVLGTELGPNLIAFIHNLYVKRIALRNIAETINNTFNLSLCHKTVENAIEIAANTVEPKTKEILKEIGAAPVIHADETRMHIGCKTGWAWIVVAAMAAYYQIAWSRSTAVMDGIIPDLDRTIICDGYAVYKQYDAMQRSAAGHTFWLRQNTRHCIKIR